MFVKIKQVVISENKLIYGLGEDNNMYTWLNGEWQPYEWEPKPPQPAYIIPRNGNTPPNPAR